MCFMDPQKKIWRGDPGHKYKLTSHQLTKGDSCAPFIFNHHCSLELNTSYPGTVIRLPLRSDPSDISSKLYDIAKLKLLLSALKNDAELLLLFLRHVESITVYNINSQNEVIKNFSVEADTSTEKTRQKSVFFKEVQEYHNNCAFSVSFPKLHYEVTISVQDIEKATYCRCKWLVMNWVGSTNSEILEMSNRIFSLPWLGLAVPFNPQMFRSSRLFCFLPMPDSDEVNPPLPVCVHGTFGLTKDRRHLKWKTSDMQNDDGALWNDLLLSKMLPSCYANCLSVLKSNCNPDVFYSFWPNVNVVNKTNWKVLLKPLLSQLLHDQLFWSRNQNWVKLQSSVYVVPELSNNSNFSEVVIASLIKCGKVVLELPNRIWEAVKFICSNEVYPFTIISPTLVRQALRSNSSSYVSMNRNEKLELLQYCLDDNNFNDLSGLMLLPVEDKSFQVFESSNSKHKIYTYNLEFLNQPLLAAYRSTLVNLETENDVLHYKLQLIAKENYTQLRILTLEIIATLLKSHALFKDGYCPIESKAFFNSSWLKMFWNWIKRYSLSAFISIPLIPISNGMQDNRFKVVSLLYKNQSQVIKCSKNEVYDHEWISAAEKLGCYISFSDDFRYLYHPELYNYIHSLSVSSFLNISLRLATKSAMFTSKEAKALRQFIFQYNVQITKEQSSIVSALCIFPAVQNNTLYSLTRVKTSVAGKNGAIMIGNSDFPINYRCYIPGSPIILICNTSVITNLQYMLPGFSWLITKAELILYVILPAIETQQLTRDAILKCTSIMLDPKEYHALANSSKGYELINQLKTLKFLPTNKEGALFSPSQVYDPDDDMVKELLKDQKVFPIDPFQERHFAVLRNLGMKNFDGLCPPDIVKVAKIIINQFGCNVKAETRRINILLEFLTSAKGCKLLNTYYNNVPLEQTLRSMQWLPVMVTPPKDYPKCLGWKGASGNRLVSARDLHASNSLNIHKKLPYLIGSQVRILNCDVPLTVKLISSLNISQNVPLNAVIQQFISLVSHKVEIERSTFNGCIKLLYEHLQSATVDNRSSSQDWKDLMQSEVVQVSEDKFVQPSSVACVFDDESMTIGKLEPYLYTLPDHLWQYKSFFCHIGVKKRFTRTDVLLVLKRIATKPSSNDWRLVTNILRWLCSNIRSAELKQLHNQIFVPVSSDIKDKLVLKPAVEVAFLNKDLEWLRKSEEIIKKITADYFLVHPSVTNDMACTLQLKPLNAMIANTEEFCYKQAGQSEPLTTRLNRILKDYKDTSVIQELLQNADDAGATEVAVYYDTREHDSSNLFFPGMANSYGPALLFYNNAEFTEEDFENITKIAGETKMNKPLKIGKFGVGFCSVYHITDVPSFVSGENFIIFDPTLQCLRNELKTDFNPGIKINFKKHYLLNKSNQLIPYTGLCEFNPQRYFKGTLFRFPLRFKESKVSKSIFTETKVHLMLNNIKENSSKLLMFLHNVKKITFWLCENGKLLKDFEIVTTKHGIPDNSSITAYKVSVFESTSCKEDNWLIASNSQQLHSDHDQHRGVASVAIKLKPNNQSSEFYIESITGECFCYLPLNIETGLPVHISSNFAVITNRRGIWKADNSNTVTKESNWNNLLMKSVVFQAYIELLLHLKSMQQNESLKDYTFHCLWPIINKLKEVNPWRSLVEQFYNAVSLSKHPVFYSNITNSWEVLNQSRFLSRTILSTNFNEKIYSSLNRVIAIFKIPVVHLPNEIWNYLSSHENFKACIIKENHFISLFYQDNILEQVSMDDKKVIVTASLIVYANNNHNKDLPELIKSTKCIPCCPTGEVFKRPQDIVDPKSQISKLFSSDDHMCPDDNFLKQNRLLYQSLVDLGMMQSLSWKLVLERAKYMQNKFLENREKSFNYLAILIECIKNNLIFKQLPPEWMKNEFKKMPFLPVMKKPDNYPVSWKGNSNALCCGPMLIKHMEHHGAINAVYACGSQITILDADAISSRLLTDKVLKFLGISKELKISHVANHFKLLVQNFHKISTIQSSKLVNYIVKEVYKYWESKINCMKELLESVSCLKDKVCIWNESENKFIHPSRVSFSWKIDGPFLYKLPTTVPTSLKPLMKQFGIKERFSVEVMWNVLCEMKQQHKETSLPKDCQNVVRLILPELKNVSSTDIKLFLPDKDFILRDIEGLRYNDAPWCDPNKEFLYCHSCIERETALCLGVIPVKSMMLEDLDVTDEFSEDFGQEEKLTQRLNNILRDYPRGITFLKELLQNADDANATKLFIILDKRFHSNEKVISEEWKQLQGPAILIWNDSMFSKEDIIGIQRIGLGSKRDDANKIGQYGIGFNVVYHFTDCPSFITDDKLCILDPHYRYAAHNKRMKPGRMYKDLKELWDRFPDMKAPYLLDDLEKLPTDMKVGGSLFRLPLRLTAQSEISDSIVDLQQLEDDLKSWVTQVVEGLLFLQNVNDVRLFIIDDVASQGLLMWNNPNPIKLLFCASSTKGQEQIIKESGNAKLVMFPMTLAVYPPISMNEQIKEMEWLVQLGKGNVEDAEFDWNKIKPAGKNFPRHGIAAPINASSFKGKSFCFLPLPGETNLPVHIHGQFTLYSDRRGIWINSDGDFVKANNDQNVIWNLELCKAISVSYAHFLINCIDHKEVPTAKQALLQSLSSYYELFS